MKLTVHAKEQLEDRYSEWGLDLEVAINIIESTKIDSDDKYRMLLIDDIPIVLICDKDEIITIYPHPIDAAENWLNLTNKIRRLKESHKSMKNAIATCNSIIETKEKYIKKIERINKKLDRQVKESWQ